MKRLLPALILFLSLAWTTNAWSHPHIIDLAAGEEIAPADLVAELREARVIFLGEVHDHQGHHRMQLEIIRALHEQGAPLAVGLEMFRHDYQEALDRWVAGEIEEENFIPIYQRNWSRWRLYRPIFVYAREQNIPLVGLNISRVITRQVAREGFASLSPEQLAELELEGFACTIDPAYEEFIRRALGGEGHEGITDFGHFCQAQLLWDRVMANQLAKFLQAHPDAADRGPGRQRPCLAPRHPRPAQIPGPGSPLPGAAAGKRRPDRPDHRHPDRRRLPLARFRPGGLAAGTGRLINRSKTSPLLLLILFTKPHIPHSMF
jgi:uncharacterized iron-regulated protein